MMRGTIEGEKNKTNINKKNKDQIKNKKIN
jgi:hypothetical protein